MVATVLLVSILLQFGAAALALRLVFVTGRWWAWVLIALALTLMGIRRSITLYRVVIDESSFSPDLTAELVALSISLLMLLGTLLIGPIFKKNQSIKQKLDETKRQYQAVVEDQTEMISRHLSDGTRTFVNDSYCTYHGENREQLIGQSVYAELAEDDLKRLKDIYNSLTAEKPSSEYEISFAGPNGEMIWQVWTKRAIFNESGQAIEYQSVGRDVSAHKRTETLNARLGRIVEQSLNEIYVFDAETLYFLQANHGAQANLGYSMAELHELTPLDIKPNITHEMFEQIIGPLRDGTEEKIMFEAVHRRKGGSEYDAEIHLQLIKSETPQVFVAIIKDISEHKRAEELLRSALVEAERANRAKSEFLATMSHEFRTPLNAILGFSEMLRAQYFGPLGAKNYHEYAKDIHDSGKHMLELVNDVLDIAAIEAGKRSLYKEGLSVVELLENCVRNFEKAASKKGVGLSINVPKRLPSLYADRRSSIQIIHNLLSNAVKFTNQNGVVSISASVADRDIEIKVVDSGIGIPSEQLPGVTEPFVQMDSNPHTAEEGTGLGLSIVKSLVEAHNGTLAIDSVVGKGTSVTVMLPSPETEII